MTTWLVIEDEPDVQDMVGAMFHVWGVDGLAFSDGLSAIAWIQAVDDGLVAGDYPVLVLLDLRLPNLSGVEVSLRLRRSNQLSGIAIVLMTAYRLNPTQEQQIREMSGADALLYKPLPSMDEFRLFLEAVVARREQASA